MKKLFGTDGVRGVANMEPMTVETSVRLGRSAAYVFMNDRRRHRIVIGKDTRLSGYMLENALVAGICSMGVDVILVGPLPTPGIAFITRSLRADAGIVISASHNTYEDNGIKFFSREGVKLPSQIESKIEDLTFSKEIDNIRPTAKKVGKAYRIDDANGRYIEFVKNSIPRGLTFDGIKIVLDCANGAAYKAAPRIFRELGAHVFTYFDTPDGMNINLNCGSTHPEIIQEAVLEHGAHIGISLDGDSDRAIFADEKGSLIDGDHVLAMCATHMLKNGTLQKNTVVATVMSNIGLDLTIKDAGGKVVRTPVGDKYVAEEMLTNGYNLGGEQSGHTIFLDHTTTGDGLITSGQILTLMQASGQRLSELASVLTTYPQVLLNVNVSKKTPLEKLTSVTETIEKYEKQFNGNGRILVRYSGTQPLLRIMVEGKNKKEIEHMAQDIAQKAQDELGA